MTSPALREVPNDVCLVASSQSCTLSYHITLHHAEPIEVLGKWKCCFYFLLEQVRRLHRLWLDLYLGPTCAFVDPNRQIEEVIKREATPKEGAQLHFKSHYPRSYWHQFLICLWRVRPPSGPLTRGRASDPRTCTGTQVWICADVIDEYVYNIYTYSCIISESSNPPGQVDGRGGGEAKAFNQV
jgi:hypothetical protein